jgi:surfactin synthase thioesterase subunit
MRGSGKRSTRAHHKRRVRVVKGLMRVAIGPTILYLTIGTNNPVKILREDVERIETDTRKQIEEMEEEELQQAMNHLNIESLSLTDDEQLIVQLASKYILAGYFILKE